LRSDERTEGSSYALFAWFLGEGGDAGVYRTMGEALITTVRE
jgi:hypothetical protein